MEKPYHLDTFTLGPWATNCYLVRDDDQGTLVDASFAPEPALDAIEQLGITLTQVVLTHAHIDHIAGLPAVRERWPDVPILIHPDEAAFLTDPALNLSAFLAEPFVGPEATGTLDHSDTVAMGGADWEVRHTPGHSPGGITLYQPDSNTAIVGDTLFAGSVGRTDFPTSDSATLTHSIREQLLTLPDETRVLPGHMGETTVGQERRSNPYL